MKISVLDIRQAGHQFHAIFAVGELELHAVIEEFQGEIVGFNFSETFFDALLTLACLNKRFNQDYFAFRAGNSRSFPWEYGEQESRILDEALRVSKRSLESLLADHNR